MDFRNQNQYPLGIRNNNPGNIRYDGTAWQGLATPPSNGGMCVFTDMKYGVRTWLMCYHAAITVHGCTTLASYIARYAPPNENNTSNYLTYVSTKTGIAPTDKLPQDATSLSRLFYAQIAMENGQKNADVVSQGDFYAGVSMFQISVSNWLSNAS